VTAVVFTKVKCCCVVRRLPHQIAPVAADISCLFTLPKFFIWQKCPETQIKCRMLSSPGGGGIFASKFNPFICVDASILEPKGQCINLQQIGFVLLTIETKGINPPALKTPVVL